MRIGLAGAGRIGAVVPHEVARTWLIGVGVAVLWVLSFLLLFLFLKPHH